MADDLGTLVAKLGADVTDLKKGLLEGKQQLASFQSVVETAGAKVKEILSFAGISLGLYEVISELKQFGASVLEVGGKVEVLKAAMYAIGQHYEISAAALDLYVKKLTDMGVLQDNALQGINNFLKAGVSIDLLPQLAAAAKDLAPSMAMPFNEAFAAIISAVTKGTPRALAELTPGIKQVVQAASSETKKLMDSTIMSGTERTQVMVDFVLAAAQKVQGAGDAVAGTYLKQLQDYKIAAHEAKEALFEIIKPVSMAITGAEIKSWQDFNVWVVNNKQALQEAGEAVALFVGRIADGIRSVVGFVAAHKDVVVVLLEIKGILTVMKWTGIAAGAEAISGVLVKLGLLRAALSGPWQLVIVATLVGADLVMRQASALTKTHPEYVGGAEWVPSEEFKEGGLAQGRKEKYKPSTAGEPSPMGGYYGQKAEKSADEAKAEVDAAAARAKLENALGGGAGKKGGGAKETTDNLLAPMLAMYKAKRAADMQEAQNSLDLLKTTNEQKRAEEAKNLAEGLIDGQTYYQRLQDLQQQETATALAMIAKKRQAQQKDYQESLSEVEADTKLSDEAKSIATQKLAAENRKALSKLDTEAAQAKLEGETKVTNELKRQFEATKQIKEKTEDLTFGTAWGPIQEQEAAIQKLVVDWARTKAEALKAAGGATPEYEAYVSAGEAKLETDIFKARYGDQISGAASAIANGLSSVVDALMSGGKDLKSAANSMFKDLFKEALKPGLDQLKQLLMDGFKDLFGSVGSGLGSALMGVIGVVGMMLTKSTTSSYTASSVSSGVTTHEVVRGVIAGETTVDIAKVSTALEEVMAPHLSVLRSIEKNTSGGKGSGGGSGGGLDVNLVVQGLGTSLKAYLDSYFQDYLLQGAGH